MITLPIPVHLRLIWPERPFAASGPLLADVVFDDGGPPPTAEQMESTRTLAMERYSAELQAADAPPPISKRQLHLWLLAMGLLDQVPALIAALPEPDRSRAEVEWQTATEYSATHPLVITFAARMGLNRDALHAAWRAAALL